MLDMQTVMGSKIWDNYPFLKRYAQDFLRPDEAYELIRAIMDANTKQAWLQDEYDLGNAFSWVDSPQGYEYWGKIFERNFDSMRKILDAGVYGVPDPIFIGGDAAEVERTNEWVPDEARADTMDITRGMFE